MTQTAISIGFRTGAVTTEQLIYAGRALLKRWVPDLLFSTGTVTFRDGAVADASGTTKSLLSAATAAIARPFVDYGDALFAKGITVQLSVATDLGLVVYEIL